MAKHQKIEAARNAILRMKALSVKSAGSESVNIVEADKVRTADSDTESTRAVKPALQFPGNDKFFMTTDGQRFFCMQRAGAQDIVHASFFSEIKCRGHMLNSHNLS